MTDSSDRTCELRYADLGDFRLASGEVLQQLRLAYTVRGDIERHRDNLVVALHSFGGDHRRMDYLVGPGKAFDPDRCCVISINAIGNGISSSPSLPGPQQGSAFPRFRIDDMVRSSQVLVHEQLGVDRVRCIVGASMGGMQALLWAALAAGEVEAAVAITPLARTPAWTRVLNELSRRILGLDGTFADDPLNGGAAGMKVVTALRSGWAVHTPDSIGERIPDPDQAAAWLDGVVARTTSMHPLDWRYTSEAYDAFDLASARSDSEADYRSVLRAIRVPTLVIGAAGDLLNPIESAREAAAQIPDASFAVLGAERPVGHSAGGSAVAELAHEQNRLVLAFLAEHESLGPAAT